MSAGTGGGSPEGALPRFGEAFAGHAALAWRAATRHRAFRVAAPLMVVLGASAPALAGAFFFFVADHTRVELPASNVFLWTAIYALVLLPPVARRIRCPETAVFGALAPASASAAALGRFAGVYAAYLSVTLILVLLAAIGGALVENGSVTALLAACLPQLALGSILVAAVFLFSQAGGALFTCSCGVLWFVLATQKSGVLDAAGSGSLRHVSTAALAWLPDFGLLRVSPDAIRATDMACLAAYAVLFVAFYLILAILRVRMSWRRLRCSAP